MIAPEDFKPTDDGGVPYVDYLPDDSDDPDDIKKTCEFISRYFDLPIHHVRFIDCWWNDGNRWHEWGRFEVLRAGVWEQHGLPDEVYR